MSTTRFIAPAGGVAVAAGVVTLPGSGLASAHAGPVVGALGLGFGVGATMRARKTATTRSDQS